MLNKAHLLFYLLLNGCFCCGMRTSAQALYPVQPGTGTWHDERHPLRYHPEGADFVITNGKRRFNRALYGTHTAFRVEAGDLPEFALYMPGMGGNLRLGIRHGNQSLWLTEAREVRARYTPGRMSYEVRDPILGSSVLHVSVLAMAGAEGLVVKTWLDGKAGALQLLSCFGGASGKKFSRGGDMGPDPESGFYLHPEDCQSNVFRLRGNSFTLTYGKVEADGQSKNTLTGQFPGTLKLSDASLAAHPAALYQGETLASPVLVAKAPLAGVRYLLISNGAQYPVDGRSAASLYAAAEAARLAIAGRVRISTPDPFINTLGATISIAADAIWESPSYLHGAVGWRMRLNGWRGPYAADPLGWHDRARVHFESYARSQVESPLQGPVVADTAFHLARQLEKMGTSMFTAGYISRDPEGKSIRPHHYDMNLVYMDELLRHFNWTGDLSLVRKMWPVIQKHLAWEKRNFDSDDDGLYDAYAAIWASDALYYSGGAVTHSSAYNYYANKMAAALAVLLGEPAAGYTLEAAEIRSAMNRELWLPGRGVYAEYKDKMGLQLLHPSAALWTVYHAIDSAVPDAFQAYESLRYIDTCIPHIPLGLTGMPGSNAYTLSTSNWMPYNWSLNNVVMAESMHTALANWQAGRNEEAFNLFRSEILADMYAGGSPGNFVQISAYDAARGEAYRDFADPIGISSRALVEGLFGILPDAIHHQLTLRPGFPAAWEHASIQLPDLNFTFRQDGLTDHYHIVPSFKVPLSLRMQLRAAQSGVASVRVNGKPVHWSNMPQAVGAPCITFTAPAAADYHITVSWKGSPLSRPVPAQTYAAGDPLKISFGAGVKVLAVRDSQQVLSRVAFAKGDLSALVRGADGDRTAFVQLSTGALTWWYPLCFAVKPALEAFNIEDTEKDHLQTQLRNNSAKMISGRLQAGHYQQDLTLLPKQSSTVRIPRRYLMPGTNDLYLSSGGSTRTIGQLISWSIPLQQHVQRMVDLSAIFNARVSDIFRNRYLSPRPRTTTLQIPWQGIGDWPDALRQPDIDDSGLRRLAGSGNQILLPQGIQLRTPGDARSGNIVFTSQWDNYPAEKVVPLSGKADHAYFLMAGSTNPMQSQLDNGKIVIRYTDGTSAQLFLHNPETWWPIQEDYYTDGYAFRLKQPRPVRIHLKTGTIVPGDRPGAEFGHQKIDGGAAILLDLPLDPQKTLESLRLITLANDVVIGLMSITLTYPQITNI